MTSGKVTTCVPCDQELSACSFAHKAPAPKTAPGSGPALGVPADQRHCVYLGTSSPHFTRLVLEAGTSFLSPLTPAPESAPTVGPFASGAGWPWRLAGSLCGPVWAAFPAPAHSPWEVGRQGGPSHLQGGGVFSKVASPCQSPYVGGACPAMGLQAQPCSRPQMQSRDCSTLATGQLLLIWQQVPSRGTSHGAQPP